MRTTTVVMERAMVAKGKEAASAVLEAAAAAVVAAVAVAVGCHRVAIAVLVGQATWIAAFRHHQEVDHAVEAAEAVECPAGHRIVATEVILAEEAVEVADTKAGEVATEAIGVARRHTLVEITMVREVAS